MPSFTLSGMLRRLFLASMLAATALAGGAAQAQNISLTDLRYDLGFMRISIPRLNVSGTSLSEADLRATLDANASGDAVQRLMRLQAASASMPEVVVEQTIDGTMQTVTYRDVTMNDIVAGVIGKMRMAGVKGVMTDKTVGKMDFSIGETLAEAMDLPLVARVLTTAVPDPQQVPLSPLYRSISYRDYVVDLPAGAGQFRLGRVSMRDTKARPGKEPLIGSFRNLMAFTEKNKGNSNATPDKAEIAMIARVVGFFENFEYGVMDMEGFTGNFGQGNSKTAFSIGKMRFSDQPQQGGFAMGDIKVESSTVKLGLAEFEMRDFSFRNSIRVLISTLESGNIEAFTSDYMKLIPKLGTIRIAGFNVEAPDTTGPRRQGPPDIFRASLKSMELGVMEQFNGIPTAIRFGAQEFATTLPSTSKEQSVRDLIAMGIKDVNLSWLADLAWQKDSDQLDIKALNFSGKDLLATSISGQLANVSKDAFSLDTALAQVAWLSASARRLTLNVQNFGGFEKIVANEARKAKKTPEALRREWGSMAAIALPAILGDSDGAKALTAAISRFVAKPGVLDIDLRSRSASGIGLADAVAVMAEPQAIFDKIEVQARAQ